ncbi:transposase [Paenibacillus sp. GCM10027626]|uniref:transposase n=1 Tax=Paenibacillus sp. GCM10027626 TaxID=3273411 RepID=UPI00363E60AF
MSISYEQFCQRFSTEKECVSALYQLKWPNGFHCPRCQSASYTLISTRRLPLYECRSCLHQTSLICGTVMEGSRTLLQKWFRAIFLIASPSSAINAVKLAEIIEVTYKTAWLILHKLRHAIGHHNANQLLEGIIKINATTYGKPYNPTIFRHPQEHPLLGGASINAQGAITHLKIQQVEERFLAPNSSHVLPAGVAHFQEHCVVPNPVDVVSFTGKRAKLLYQPLIQLCKEAYYWLNDTFHGIGGKHLQAYLHEFCFTVNYALQQQCPFTQLCQLSATTARITYKRLTHKNTSAAAKQPLAA